MHALFSSQYTPVITSHASVRGQHGYFGYRPVVKFHWSEVDMGKVGLNTAITSKLKEKPLPFPIAPPSGPGPAPHVDKVSPGRRVQLKMKALGWFRSYLNSSPVPMRTVFLAAAMLSVLYVFTSFIGRTQLGTDMTKFDWWMQAPGPFLNFFMWALLLPLVNGWSRRWPLNARPFLSSFIPLFLLGFLVCVAHEVITNVVYIAILNYSGRMPWQQEMIGGALLSLPAGVVQRFMEYWLLLVLLRYVETHRQIRAERTRVLQLQNELQAAKLLSLKKQLQPHFLFNTLNTVSALMDVDAKSARTVLSRLGQLLRSTLDEERHETVPLIHEVDHTSYYLGIETIRFKDRLNVYYDIPSDCQHVPVPGMILQPLVENSIKHGLDATNEAVSIRISAHRENGSVKIQVSDDGKGCADVTRALAHGGIGLQNVQERLGLLYGEAGKMHVTSKPGHGFQVTMSIPVAGGKEPAA